MQLEWCTLLYPLLSCSAGPEAQATECGYFGGVCGSARHQHLKILSHAFGSDQMLELQRQLRPFLRDAAVFESVGELVSLANAHQKLRLRAELLDPHSRLRAGGGQGGEIDMGGEVLLARSLVGIGTCRIMAVRHESTAMATSELLVAGVTVVNDQQQAVCDRLGDLPDPILGEDGNFDALARFRMDAVAVEEFQFLGDRRQPGLAQAVIFQGDVELAGGAQNFYGEGVEEFVGEDDDGSFRAESANWAGRPSFRDLVVFLVLPTA